MLTPWLIGGKGGKAVPKLKIKLGGRKKRGSSDDDDEDKPKAFIYSIDPNFS